MALLKNIEWVDNSKNTIVYKYKQGSNQVNKGSVLTVRESQVAIFVYKGKVADVFEPGFYKLDTDNMPIITKLLSWKYSFETPFKADIYFVNTKLFTNQKWGTSNPILIRDKDYGAVRVRGFGTYRFKVNDARDFMNNLSGTNSSYETDDINNYLKSLIVSSITDTIGENKIPVLDLAGNLEELSNMVKEKLTNTFKEIGITLAKFNFENFSLPEEIEKALDKNATLNIYKGNMETYTQVETLEAMKNAASNPGGMGGTFGAGLGLSMGLNMANQFNNNASKAQQAYNKVKNESNTMFCTNCGAKVPENAKFCSECGNKLNSVCPKCGATIKDGAKFCSECGERLN